MTSEAKRKLLQLQKCVRAPRRRPHTSGCLRRARVSRSSRETESRRDIDEDVTLPCCRCRAHAGIIHVESPEERRRATATPRASRTAERILQPVARREEEVLPWKPTLTCRKKKNPVLSCVLLRLRERERGGNHRWASSITIIYLEVWRCSAAAAAPGL